MSPLKLVAPWNNWFMLVTVETFQADRLPLRRAAPWNIWLMSVTPDRSGASTASYAMLAAPLNDPAMVAQVMFPHCPMDCSFAAFALLPPR